MKRDLPTGISRVLVRPKGNRKPYWAFQVSGSPGGVRKCWRVVIHVRGEDEALRMAKEKRAEWEKTSKPWGKAGGFPARLRIDPKSVPEEMQFPGLIVCGHRAVVMASRALKCPDGKHRTIYLCYPYSIEGGSLPTFGEAIEQCRKGQGVLNQIPADRLPEAWKANKAANRARKRGENMANALLTFAAFKDGPGTKQEMASLSHAYDRAS